MKKSASKDIAELQKRANLFIDALQFLSEKKAACELAKQEINEIRQFCALAHKNYGAKCDQILNERQYKQRIQEDDDIYSEIVLAVLKKEGETRYLEDCEEFKKQQG